MNKQPHHKGLEKYRAVRAKGKAKAIARQELLAQNPSLINDETLLHNLVEYKLNQHKRIKR